MKTLKNILTGIGAITVFSVVLFTALNDQSSINNSQTGEPAVYESSDDKLIGITPEKSALGLPYSIRSSSGYELVEGLITSVNTFYIPTAKLGTGAYELLIGNSVLGKFYIK